MAGFLITHLAFAQQTTVAQKSMVKVGVYITQLGDFDMSKNSYTISFWSWYLHPKKSYKPLETAEIINAKTLDLDFMMSILKDNFPQSYGIKKLWLTSAKYTATIFQTWNVKTFPFDRQVLEFYIEDGVSDNNYINYVADVENSRIDYGLIIPGWKIEKFEIKEEKITYDTTFGDPEISGSSTYSRIKVQITIKREGVRLLFNMFVGFFIAFMLVSLTYFLDVETMAASRISLCTGAIFAAIGNKYVIDNYLPHPSNFTLADSIELSTFLTIIISIIVVIILLPNQAKYPKASRWLNYSAALTSTLLYLTWNGFFIMDAAI
jgi:hypothetical protein